MEYRSHNYCKTSDTSFIKKEHKKVKGMDTRTFIISQYRDLLFLTHYRDPNFDFMIMYFVEQLFISIRVYLISCKNTFSVKKVRPSKVESYLEVNT